MALYQNRAKTKELESGRRDREADDETLLATLKGSPLGVGQLEEVLDAIEGTNARLLMMIMLS